MRRNTNQYIFQKDHVEIRTRRGDIILIDHEDYEKCRLVSWCVDSKGYANGKSPFGGTVRLHRFILDPGELHVDHINRNKLDNRRSNLRIVTNQQNHFNESIPKNNKSGHLGVYWNRQCRKWCSQITVDGKTISGGLFSKLEDAVRKREELEKIYFQISEGRRN